MSEAKVLFFTEDINFTFQHTSVVNTWLCYVAENEESAIVSANIILCSDEYILGINQEYLSHDYFTDIITFPLMDAGAPIEADIFISIETVASNAEGLNISFKSELLRVIVHGFLHMLGYDDKTDLQKTEMRQREDFYLNYFNITFE